VVQRAPSQLLDHIEHLGALARWWHPDGAHVALHREARVLNPSGPATSRARLDEALTQPRHVVEASADMAAQLVQPKPAVVSKKRGAVED
jgi:hypothetical protein